MPGSNMIPTSTALAPVNSGSAAGIAIRERLAVSGQVTWLRLALLPQILTKSAAAKCHVYTTRGSFGRLVLALGLFALIIPAEIVRDSEMFVSRRIFGIPPHYAITAFVFAIAIITDLRYYGRLIAKPLVAFSIAVLLYVLVIGVLRHGVGSQLVRSDVYIVRWFVVGFLLMRLAISSGYTQAYFIGTAIVLLAVTATVDYQTTHGHEIATGERRAVVSSIYRVLNCGTIMIGLGLTAMWPRSRLIGVFFVTAYLSLVFLGGIRTSTRSLFGQQVLCFLLILAALYRDPRTAGRGKQLGRATLALVAVVASYVVWQVTAGGLLTDYTLLGGRFSNLDLASDGTFVARVTEVRDLVLSLSADEWVLGQGLGGMFYSALGYWNNTPHIAVAAWLQKGGLAVFLVVLYSIYYRPMVGFLRALWKANRNKLIPAPVLVVGPAFVSWLFLTFVSGGIDTGAFLGLGGLVAFWMQLAVDVNQLGSLRSADHARGAPMARYFEMQAAV